ncbi:hypothetical protein Fot_07272 [Forsythia ovata]|uniref:Uncharacterized protein n=1 Tax=Forsythia ovata TaxID=205694 RepID=A0ABD1WY83_9LAMI
MERQSRNFLNPRIEFALGYITLCVYFFHFQNIVYSHHSYMIDCGDSDLEEIGRTDLKEIVVIVEPVRAICPVTKMAFNANYFKMLRRKRLEQFYEVINLSDSEQNDFS